MRRTVNALGNLSWGRRAWAVGMACAMTGIASYGQTETTLYTFCHHQSNCTAAPWVQMVQGTNGDLYGTTSQGGSYGLGSVYKITTGGRLTTLYSFCALKTADCPDGNTPSGLVQGSSGDFYGTSNQGIYGGGTVFKISPSGELTTLYSFCAQPNCADGSGPNMLVQATNGDFYGTTAFGGVSEVSGSCTSAGGCGTAFKITPSGGLTTLHSFCQTALCTDGSLPTGALVLGTDGNLYGTTWEGASFDFKGSVFKMTPAGKLTTVAAVGFTAGLMQATDGNFYMTTGTFGGDIVGQIIKMTPEGALTLLAEFPPPATPNWWLVQGTDGNLYGTTEGGGANNNPNNPGCENLGCGSVFQVTLGGMLTTLYSFCSQPNCSDGFFPMAGLVQATNGNFYGTTTDEAYETGTVFSLSVGLGPFVKTQTTSGKVGAAVKILGTNLTGATSVTFNGTSVTTFTVNSTGSAISTTVPTGATTGTVQVVTPGGTLSSNVPFRVP